jgi:hypothetical protein
MATLNDYKLLEQKCIRIFDMISVEKIKAHGFSQKEKARFGFYYYVIQTFTGFSELDDITDCICDTDFNTRVLDDPQVDEGIDAVCIDEEQKEINIFNFKYRDSFNPDKEQSKNETWQSSKFFSCILTENVNALSPRMKELARRILDLYNSSDIWKTNFYVVSNENKELSLKDSVVTQMQDMYDLQVVPVGLNQIAPFLSSTHKEIDATIVIPNEAVMSFTEYELSSSKSYVVRMSLSELIRITCKDELLRNFYNIENLDQLKTTDIDFNVLFDNVRGYILKSKFNSNIEKTLDDDPTKFFFYNNGLTIVAENITSTSVNGGKKLKLDIKNFQVLNGGQTLRTIHQFNRKNDANLTESIVKAEVLVRILNVTDPNLKNCIAEYTNSQNAIDLIDLKSLRKEQIDLETFFREHKILYARKKGQTDLTLNNAKFQIGIQRLGQILTSTIRHRPEESSNKKKEIFSTYYDELFTNNENLISQRTLETVELYHSLKSLYRRKKLQYTEQKAMYILFMKSVKPSLSTTTAITMLENKIEGYRSQHSIDAALSRILIRNTFRSELENELRREI